MKAAPLGTGAEAGALDGVCAWLAAGAEARLPPGALLGLRGRSGTVIRCLEGDCWLTREGDPRDHRLRTGERFRVDGAGSVIVQALAESRLGIEGAQKSARPSPLGSSDRRRYACR
jgi:hypothetical protein